MSIVPFVSRGLIAAGVGRALIPTIEKVVAKGVLVFGGATLARQVYDAYVAFRRAGHGHKRARHMAHHAAGFVFKRRRMRATNTRALRRAIRRVRSFQRIARKTGALGVSRRGRPRIVHHRRKVHRRGDVPATEGDWVVEDTADVYDEAEDLGYGDDEEFLEATGE